VSSNLQQRHEQIADEAAHWYVLNRGEPLEREARAEFFEWLKRSPRHVEEYLGLTVITRDLAAATDAPEFGFEALLARSRTEPDNVVVLERARPLGPVAAAPRRAARAWTRAAVAAAALLLVALVTVVATRDGERFGLTRSYRTAHGEQRLQALPDGSVLHLNTDSEVTLRYDRADRVVEVKHGQALFQVAHDAQRRFRISAGRASVLAVGTEFDVYRTPGSVRVTVVAGSVAVFAGAAPPAATRGELPAGAVRLDAGFQLEVTDRIGAPRRVDPREVTAWLQRQIAFESQPLGAVADEFNRYGRIALEIDDPRLRALPISGVFDAYDADSFTAFLATLNGVAVEKTPTRIRVVTSATAGREPASNPR
jgi:transmembrane sensor